MVYSGHNNVTEIAFELVVLEVQWSGDLNVGSSSLVSALMLFRQGTLLFILSLSP